ncbi:MAG TPA: glycosyltransferase [Candidatus Methylomirabilis sp.]|nr:glycosyltransferase [Candidatus Methylomirabilis sp.]
MTAPFYPHATGVVGIIALAIWLHLFFGRGWFWRVKKLDVDRGKDVALDDLPSVTAVVPARNEAETIGQVVKGLLAQDYPGEFSIVVVDDHSEDSTAEIARQTALQAGTQARLQIVSAPALPEGWTGKVWAMNSGAAAAANPPAFYWFTDADVHHAPDTLRRFVVQATQKRADLASLMVLLQSKTFPERALIPAFLYFFLMLYPPQWISDEELKTAGAAGGCILLRREALERIGGLAAIRNEVIDDCALAKKVKQSSGRVWMGLTRKSTSLRAYGTWGEIRDLIARTAFTQLRYSAILLAGTLAGMLLTYAAPIALLFTHDSIARVLGLAAWLLMSLSFLPTVGFYRLSPLWAPLLPLAALFYTYATWLSAVRYWLGRGGQWKGRAQAPKGAS